MKILLIGPNHDNGSLPPYLKVLYNSFLEHGVNVNWIGSKEIPFDKKNNKFLSEKLIIDAAQNILFSVNVEKYDIISLHYGNLEVEQLIPYILKDRPHPPIVYHVHTLEPTLFKLHVKNDSLCDIVKENKKRFSGLLFFGNYAKKIFGVDNKPNSIAWLPTTISPNSNINTDFKNLISFDDDLPMISMYGFAAPWKSLELLLSAMKYIKKPVRFVIAGPFWDDFSQSGVNLKLNKKSTLKINNAELIIISQYVGEKERKILVKKSYSAIFPYKFYKSFQGSGAIADYLVNSVPVIATDIANMKELINFGGLVIPHDNPKLLAKAVDDMSFRYNEIKSKTKEQAYKFTPKYHSKVCLNLYKKLM
jgi:hypothetical protein